MLSIQNLPKGTVSSTCMFKLHMARNNLICGCELYNVSIKLTTVILVKGKKMISQRTDRLYILLKQHT